MQMLGAVYLAEYPGTRMDQAIQRKQNCQITETELS